MVNEPRSAEWQCWGIMCIRKMKPFPPKLYMILVNHCEILNLSCKENMFYPYEKPLEVELKGSGSLSHNVVWKLRAWDTCADAKSLWLKKNKPIKSQLKWDLGVLELSQPRRIPWLFSILWTSTFWNFSHCFGSAVHELLGKKIYWIGKINCFGFPHPPKKKTQKPLSTTQAKLSLGAL